MLPLLASDCLIPAFLRDKKYADFRQSYDVGFQELISCLKPNILPACVSPTRLTDLATILALIDSSQWILNISNLLVPFAGGDRGTLEKRKRLNLATVIAKRVDYLNVRFVSEYGGTTEFDVTSTVSALRELIRLSDRLLPQIGERKSKWELTDLLYEEYRKLAIKFVHLLPYSGDEHGPNRQPLLANPALHAEFFKIHSDNDALCKLMGFEGYEALEKHLVPNLLDLLKTDNEDVQDILRFLLAQKNVLDEDLLNAGFTWATIEPVLNALLSEKLVSYDGRDPARFSLTDSGSGRLTRLLKAAGRSPM